MKITMESTTKIVRLDGVPARIWEGKTESGISVHCFVTRIAADKSQDLRQLDKELQEHRRPSPDIEAYPLRMIL